MEGRAISFCFCVVAVVVVVVFLETSNEAVSACLLLRLPSAHPQSLPHIPHRSPIAPPVGVLSWNGLHRRVVQA